MGLEVLDRVWLGFWNVYLRYLDFVLIPINPRLMQVTPDVYSSVSFTPI